MTSAVKFPTVQADNWTFIMKKLPSGLAVYKTTPVFTEKTVPQGLLTDHTTKPGVWGRIVVEDGTLLYEIPAEGSFLLSPDQPGIVAPTVPHRVTPLGKVSFFVEFLRDAGKMAHSATDIKL